MTSGERRFARRLESHLEDDYICWYDVPVGSSHQHPDFLVLHPRRGLLVIEVKDWKLGNLRAIDKVSATLYVEGKEIRTANPFEQARQYAHRVTQLLQSDRALIAEPGSSYQGKLICPWGYGVVLANISRNAFTLTDLGQVIPPERVICQDEMVESVDAEAFQQRLWGMFGVTFRCRVMDLQQEQLARSMGEGHRVIHGVAGSGKTMILGYRAQYLAQALANKPILILCFNRALAARTRKASSELGWHNHRSLWPACSILISPRFRTCAADMGWRGWSCSAPRRAAKTARRAISTSWWNSSRGAAFSISSA